MLYYYYAYEDNTIRFNVEFTTPETRSRKCRTSLLLTSRKYPRYLVNELGRPRGAVS